jgi:hypothetical protein
MARFHQHHFDGYPVRYRRENEYVHSKAAIGDFHSTDEIALQMSRHSKGEPFRTGDSIDSAL